MKAFAKALLVLTLAGALSTCSSSPVPPDTGLTPPIALPSPPVLEAQGFLNQQKLLVNGQVSRPAGQPLNGISVTVVNSNTGQNILVFVDAQSGSFNNVRLDVSTQDLVLAQAEDPATNQLSNIVQALIPGQEGLVLFGPDSGVDSDQDGTSDSQELLNNTNPNLNEAAGAALLRSIIKRP